MLATDDQIKETISKQNLLDIEMLDVIRKYIFDMKEQDIGEVVKPQNITQHQLMLVGYNVAQEYYKKKFNI